MTAADLALADAILRGQVDLFRYEAHVRTRILGLLTEMEQALLHNLRNAATPFGQDRLQSQLRLVTATLDAYYERAAIELDRAIHGTVQVSVAQAAPAVRGAAQIGVSLGVSIPTEAQMRKIASDVLVFGAQVKDWWSKQKQTTRFAYAAQVRLGMALGETNEQLAMRISGSEAKTIRGVMNITRAQARSLVHSSVLAAGNDARLDVYERNGDVIRGLQQLSTLDSHTTEICIAYSGQSWDLKTKEPMDGSDLPFNGGPPRHWGCRSILVPVLIPNESIGLPPLPVSTRASAAGPVAADITFDQFLKRQGREFQDQTLGKGRAELWRSGKMSLVQLLDLRGNPLTLEQLQRKYGGK